MSELSFASLDEGLALASGTPGPSGPPGTRTAGPAADHGRDPSPASGALGLLHSAVSRFWAWASPTSPGVWLHVDTTIPRQVGLAGSSALVVASFRALARAHGLTLDPFWTSEEALAVEVEDLGIAAGPMDRVIQAYEGVIAMDLTGVRSPERYVALDPGLLPPLFVAWTPEPSKSSGDLHAPLRKRWLAGDAEVRRVVTELAQGVDEGVAALQAGDVGRFGALMTRNFHLRRGIFSVSDEDVRMVELAESFGCPAKLAGSGGCIVGDAAWGWGGCG